MFRKLSFVCVLLGLAGCADQPTDRAQQYLDGGFSSNLNKVGEINSDKPSDFSAFKKQSAEVLERSESMSLRYEELYVQLQKWIDESSNPAELSNYGIQFAQMGGGDKKGNVMFTGYFSPVIEMRHTPNETFKYPVYDKPDCGSDCPTRAEINAGALAGLGLELGYADNMIDPFIMEVQGSGFVHFGDDDKLEYFAYGGKNNHPYVSIGRILIERGEVERKEMSLKAIKEWVAKNDEATVRELLETNPSYVFFSPKEAHHVLGTAGIPLYAGAAVAADRTLLPMGTPILAEVPQLDKDGKWTGKHVLKVLLALDTGGAVKENHLDQYYGMGTEAGIAAGHFKHFGRVWKLGLQDTETENPWEMPKSK
ncbi:murein transglycosylase A [Aliivibrio fischeri]|uniref:murein transglycosylase A n=1 Tax=Aliivibrio fischeri TaxID=668 RepID=UPI00084CC793|nr:murein transglycosylase A [Aliivibrio fischeri]OED51254.1 murein transglycosylase A [Aliivibrio fischeri]